MKNVKAKQKLSLRRRLLFTLITIFIFWLIVDSLAYIGLNLLGKKKNIFFTILPAESNEQIARWYKHLPFHPRWGWDHSEERLGSYGNRIGRKYEKKDHYYMKVFGDSFVYGAGVEDNETFEYLFEEKTGKECLNFGVVGYGTDQALLKYIDNRIKTKFTVLCILDENIERIVNYCRGLESPRMALQPKPRFVLKTDNTVLLLDNPIKNVSDLDKLKDISFLTSLRKYDYWSKYYKKLNAPSGLRWPATLTIITHIDYFFLTSFKHVRHVVSPTYDSHFSRWPYNHLYKEGSEGIAIMYHIVDLFAKTAKMKGELPVVIIFPKRETMGIIKAYRKKPYQTLVKYLEQKSYLFIDIGEALMEKQYSKYYIPDGHFSVAGNKVIANELFRLCQKNKNSTGPQ